MTKRDKRGEGLWDAGNALCLDFGKDYYTSMFTFEKINLQFGNFSV